MDTIDGLGYVATVSHIEPSAMSKGMFKFVRAAARAAAHANTGRQDVAKFLFPAAAEPAMTPAQERLQRSQAAKDWLFQDAAW